MAKKVLFTSVFGEIPFNHVRLTKMLLYVFSSRRCTGESLEYHLVQLNTHIFWQYSPICDTLCKIIILVHQNNIYVHVSALYRQAALFSCLLKFDLQTSVSAYHEDIIIIAIYLYNLYSTLTVLWKKNIVRILTMRVIKVLVVLVCCRPALLFWPWRRGHHSQCSRQFPYLLAFPSHLVGVCWDGSWWEQRHWHLLRN